MLNYIGNRAESTRLSVQFNSGKIATENWERTVTLFNKEALKYFAPVSPETILYKWKKTVSNYWTSFTKNSNRKPGRPPMSKAIKELILKMKRENYLWGFLRISDEIKKLNIDVCKESVRNVIQTSRKKGLLKPNLSWNKFLKAHWESIYACDCFTLDLFGFRRFYIFFIIELKSRKIIHWNCTQNPDIKFLRLQFSYFEEKYPDSWLIHDNSGELKWFPYHEYQIKDVAITPYSPDMNAYAERFIRSARNECFDHFIIFNQKQLRNIMKEYVQYYNNFRPHQGVNRIPNEKTSDASGKGKIRKKAVLFGLHHHYYRDAS